MKAKFFANTLFSSCLLIGLANCGGAGGGEQPAGQELAHVLGDAMGSADEALGSASSVLNSRVPTLSEKLWTQASKALIPFAQIMGTCDSTSVSSCSSGVATRTYDSCTFGSLTLNGGVIYEFSDTDCELGNNNDSVRRVPDFEISGRNGGTIGVSVFNPSSSGQKLTRSSSTTYDYEVSGLRRYFTDSSSNLTVNYTIQTVSDITITGLLRANRRMTGGTLKITDNITGSETEITPSAVKWSSTCTCASSGSWIGQTTSDTGVTEDFTLTMTSCGQATMKKGTEESSVELERCIGS